MAQIAVSENYKQNLQKIKKIISENDFDIIVFPELALTSYCLDKVTNITNKEIEKSIISIQSCLSRKQLAIVGTIWRKNKKKYNAAALIFKNNIKFYYKSLLTKYDSDFFDAKMKPLVVIHQKKRIGVLICRDQNNLKLIEKYKNCKCDYIFQLSAHYYNEEIALKKLDKNVAMSIVRAIDTKSLFFKVNTVGKNSDYISLGTSMIVNSDGVVLRKANQYEEEIVKFNTKVK